MSGSWQQLHNKTVTTEWFHKHQKDELIHPSSGLKTNPCSYHLFEIQNETNTATVPLYIQWLYQQATPLCDIVTGNSQDIPTFVLSLSGNKFTHALVLFPHLTGADCFPTQVHQITWFQLDWITCTYMCSFCMDTHGLHSFYIIVGTIWKNKWKCIFNLADHHVWLNTKSDMIYDSSAASLC